MISIRPATRTDVCDILTLIRELGDYEKLAHEVVATEQSLEQNLFCEDPFVHVFMAHTENQLAGFALYFYNFSTFLGRPGVYLEDLFVRPTFRGQGIGKKLMQEVALAGLARGCGRMEWSVLNWNTPALDFYNSLGARAMSDWTVHRLSESEMRNLVG